MQPSPARPAVMPRKPDADVYTRRRAGEALRLTAGAGARTVRASGSRRAVPRAGSTERRNCGGGMRPLATVKALAPHASPRILREVWSPAPQPARAMR